MYIITDEVFNRLMGGDFVQVIEAMRVQPNAPVRKLYNLQFDYFSYEGFRKFFNKVISKIHKDVSYYDDNGVIGRALKFMVTHYNEKK